MHRPLRRAAAALALVALAATPAAAQNFAGTWINDDPANTSEIRLVLTDAGDGRLAGTLSGAGTTVALEGLVRDGEFAGRADWNGSIVLLEGELVDDALGLMLITPNPDGSPNYERASYVEFARAGAARTPVERPETAGGPANIDGDPMSASPLARQWAAHLVGKKLTQLDSYGGSEGGYSSRRELLLCPTGQFHYRESSSVNADVGGVFGSSAGGSGGTGQWRVLAQGQLVGLDLRFSDGRHWQVRLEDRGGAVHVDGVRTYVTPGEGCP